jgi:DNA-binding transcriptional MocR family regulator
VQQEHTPGDNYGASDDNPPHIRISYVAAPSPADIHDAIRRLAGVMSEAG